ncbi:MAG TPA: hypothetical protein VNC14_11620, partial [Lapillicoccus sp.]|nr:hypothetical protein [Lapillicoccus sp.]
MPTAARPSGGCSEGASRVKGYASGLAPAVVARRVTAAVETAADIVGDAARALATPTGLAGATVEALWLATHLAIYPFGVLGAQARDVSHGYRIEHLAPAQRGLVISDIEAAGTPILLLHGMADNRSVFTLLRRG